MFTPGPRLWVTPSVTLIDEPVHLHVEECVPGEQVRLVARMTDDGGHAWAAHAIFRPAADGTIDPAREAPESGTYSGVDPMGLFWSMRPEQRLPRGSLFTKATLTAATVIVSIETHNITIASTFVERRFIAPGVLRTMIRERGIIGTLFRPDDDGPHPAVIVLSGEDGGLYEHGAALLASHGFVALSLAYFGLEGLPDRCVRVPLEYGLTALEWLDAQDWVLPGGIAIVGWSCGGELALLLGANYPRVRAVVASNAMTLIQAESHPDGTTEPRWICDDQPVPAVTGRVLSKYGPLRTAQLRRLLHQHALREDCAIPLERIHGPVLFLTASDDAVLPSRDFAEFAISRSRSAGHPAIRRHVTFKDAGHALGTPAFCGLPHVPPDTRPEYGGTMQGNARANRAAWQELLTFLREVF